MSGALPRRSFPSNELHERAMALCRRLAAQPRLAMSMGKMLVNQATVGDIRNGLGQELLAQTALFNSEEYLSIKEEALRRRRNASG